MEDCILKLKWKLKMVFIKLKYPKEKYHTRVVLANGFSLSEINEWVDDYIVKDGSIYDKREYVCEEEISNWHE